MQITDRKKGVLEYFRHSSQFYFILTDPGGNYLYGNPLFLQRFNIIAAPFPGNGLETFFIPADAGAVKETLQRCLEDPGHPVHAGLHIKMQDDPPYFIKWEVSACLDEENRIESIQWIGADTITEQRMPEQHLQQSELFYRNLIADSLDGILLTDEKGFISFTSSSVTKLLGYDTLELTGKSFFDYVSPGDRGLAVTTFEEEARMQPRVKFINIRLLKKNGDKIWCIVRSHNLLGNPYIGRMAVYFYDDSLRKKAEEALLESGRRLRTQATILNNVTDVIVTTDTDRVVTSWNKVTEKLTGITSKEAMGRPFREIIETDYSPYTHDQVAGIVATHGIWRGEISFEGSSGERKYLLHTVSQLQNDERQIIGLLGVGKDITERKKIEARLQESEIFYRNLISYSLDGIVLTDHSGQVVYCAPSVTKLSGYEPQHLLGHSIFEFVHPDDYAAASDAFFTEIKKESAIDYIVMRLKHSTNDWVWCTVRGHNLLDNPVFNAFVVYFTNDTKRKEIENRLKESEYHFRNLIYNLNQGIVLQNAKGEVVVCNKAAEQILGITEEELLGTTSYEKRWDTIHEDGSNFPGNTHPASLAIQTKKSVRDVVMGLLRSKIGDRIWVLVSADPGLDTNGNITNVVISFTDITEQKRLSQELIDQEIQKQKQLTQATIDGQEKERREIGKELHDNINQHLTTTRLYLEVAKEKASGEVLEMISLSHQNLAAIIKEIRQLSQSLVPPTLGDLGLVESVYDLCDSLKRAHTFQIEFLHRHFNEEELPGNCKLMLFRIIQEQVSNIVKHAGAYAIQIRLQSDAEYIILSIIDDGKGFDPNNYTKGLGFSNITNRAGLFNGKVEIDAAPGHGCTLSVIIPLEGSTNSTK
ncbi:MAG: PAS domain S-box protein [Chitinophagaceae bacterium]